jgi:hypothetical protein
MPSTLVRRSLQVIFPVHYANRHAGEHTVGGELIELALLEFLLLYEQVRGPARASSP